MTEQPATWLRPEFQGCEADLIHLAAAADMVGVTRSAVSNWAARHANFPKIALLTGAAQRRTKWVVRDEFLAFARAQLNKRRDYSGPKGPHRPRIVILSERIAHWEAQVPRLAELEARRAAALKGTREALRSAQANLRAARDALAAEIEAASNLGGPPASGEPPP